MPGVNVNLRYHKPLEQGHALIASVTTPLAERPRAWRVCLLLCIASPWGCAVQEKRRVQHQSRPEEFSSGAFLHSARTAPVITLFNTPEHHLQKHA